MLVDIKFCSMSICLMVEKLSTVTGSFQVVELNLKQTNKQITKKHTVFSGCFRCG